MNPTDPAAYDWPLITPATLLAGLRATSAKDEAARWSRLLGGAR